MILDTATSINGTKIRLTEERWNHAVNTHQEINFVVPYKEITEQDGFVLTAYFTSDLTWLFKKEIVWSKQ